MKTIRILWSIWMIIKRGGIRLRLPRGGGDGNFIFWVANMELGLV